MTLPAPQIVDEKPGSAATVDALLSDEAIPLEKDRTSGALAGSKTPLTPAGHVKADKDVQTPSGDDAQLPRVLELIAVNRLEAEGKPLAHIRELARKSGRSLLEETKEQARLAKNARDKRVKRGQPVDARAKPANAEPAPQSGKATGKGYSGIRNIQSAQTLLAQKDREIAQLREKGEREAVENAARLARLETRSEGQGLDELTAGFAAMLAFAFDGLSELRRLHYGRIAQLAGNRPLDRDELAAINAWSIPDDKASAIARPFAQYFHLRMGDDVLQLLPLFIGIAGIGAHVLHGVQAERLADAHPIPHRLGPA